MKKLILIASAALALAACHTPLSLEQAPAPLAAVTVDDSGLATAWKTFDAALDAVNLALDAKPSLIGTPGARRLADAIDAVSLGLTSAESAAAAGSTTDYKIAMAKTKDALTEMRQAIAALKGVK